MVKNGSLFFLVHPLLSPPACLLPPQIFSCLNALKPPQRNVSVREFCMGAFGKKRKKKKKKCAGSYNYCFPAGGAADLLPGCFFAFSGCGWAGKRTRAAGEAVHTFSRQEQLLKASQTPRRHWRCSFRWSRGLSTTQLHLSGKPTCNVTRNHKKIRREVSGCQSVS